MFNARRRVLSTVALTLLGPPVIIAQERKPARIAILSRSGGRVSGVTVLADIKCSAEFSHSAAAA